VPTKLAHRIQAAQRVTAALGREGRRSIDALQRIRDAIATERFPLSLVRVLDIALWFAHPAASGDGSLREISVTVRR